MINRNDIIRMAREAGGVFIDPPCGDCYTFDIDDGTLERFAALVAAHERDKLLHPVECDGDFPEGFDASIGIPAQALRTANAAMFDLIDKREWDVPCIAMHIIRYTEAEVLAEREACAKVASGFYVSDASNYPSHIATAIRARGETSTRGQE